MNRTLARKGIALATTLWIVVLIAILAFALLTLSNLTNFFSWRELNEVLAYEAAQAGVAQAMYNLSQDRHWNEGFSNVAVPDSTATYSLTFASPQAYYSVNNLVNFPPANGYFCPATVPGGTAQLLSVGTSFLGGGKPVKRVIFASIKTGGQSVWGKFALFGENSMRFVGGAETDSFNSAEGSYADTHSDTGGDIGTNAISAGAISLGSNVTIHGGIFAGPDGVETTVVSKGKNTSYTSFDDLSQPLETPDVQAPAGSGIDIHYSGNNDNYLPPGTYGSLMVSGKGNLILSSGVYVFNGEVKFGGTSDIVISESNGLPVTGPVVVYAKDDWDSSGNPVVNLSYRPRYFQLYGTPDCNTMKISGVGQAYYAVYANHADVEVKGNGDLFGAVVGQTIYMNGTADIHHDIDLTEVGPSPAGGKAKLLGWYEL